MNRLSMCGKTQESGLTEIIPLMCTSALWGQHPAFLHPESPRCTVGGSFSVCWLDGCSIILCLLIWQVTFFVHNHNCTYLERRTLVRVKVAGSLGSGCNASVGKESDSCLVVISFCMIPFVLGFPVAPHFYISLLLTELWP